MQHKVRRPILAEVRALPPVEPRRGRVPKQRLTLRSTRTQAEMRAGEMHGVAIGMLGTP